jgi:hypothetical protein
MAHNHGNEYQIRIVREDGTEELSGWMNTTEQVAKAMILAYKTQGTKCWLLVCNIVCPDCSERKQLLEYPIMEMPSARYIPHDSRYLQVVESRNRYVLGITTSRRTA